MAEHDDIHGRGAAAGPTVPASPQPIDYRPGGPPAKSQWMTDDEAYGGCLVYGLLGLTAVGAVAGAVGWLIWTLLGFF